MNELLLNLLDFSLFASFAIFAGTSVKIWVAKLQAHRASEKVYTMWSFNKWPALGFVVINPALAIVLDGQMNLWGWLNSLAFALFWWSFRNIDDDDVTRRRKRKFTVKIEQLQGRLVVVPA